MATQYTSILKLALPVQGELSGTWGDVVNDNITSMVEEAIAGRKVINTWTGNSHTLTTADGTTSESRAAILTLTDTGTALTGAGTVICPAASKVYIVENGTGQAITIKTASGTGIAVPDGKNMVVFCDATNVEEGITNINSLTLNGDGATVSSIKDEDNMASNSATALATQQSIKAYVDSQVGANNELSEVLANGNTTGGTDISVSSGDDITFADSSKAIFGAGSDLQIYHSGAASYISDTGDGSLLLTGNGGDISFFDTANSAYMVRANTGGDVQISHAGTVRLATTSTGIDVTGDVVNTGGLYSNVNNSLKVISGGNASNAGSNLTLYGGTNASAGTFRFRNGTATHLEVAGNGDISFYEDTGTTAKLFWDASAESLGIGQGVFSGTQALNLKGEGIAIKNDKSGSNNNWSLIRNTGTASTSNVSFVTGAGEALVLAHDTNVGIGTSSPNSYSNLKTLTINGTNGSVVDFETNGTLSGEIFAESNSLKIDAVGSSGVLKLLTNSTERMRIDTSGNVGIGTSSPTAALDVRRSDASGIIAEFHNNVGYGIDIGSSTAEAYISSGYQQDFLFKTNAGSGQVERMRIDSSGRVGIGTSSPATGTHSSYGNLVIGETTSATSGLSFKASTTGQSAIFFSDGASPFNRGQVLYDHSSDHLAFASAGTERMRIDSSGVVQISNATPTLKFTDTDNNYDATIQGLSGSLVLKADSGAEFGTESIQFRTGGDEAMRIDSSGRVGIGTSSPSGKLSISGATATNELVHATFTNTQGAKTFAIGAGQSGVTNNGFVIRNVTDNTFPLVISDAGVTSFGAGNVGIGTSSPLSKLNVKGTQGNWRVDPDSVSGEIQVLSTTVANDGFRNFRLRSNESIFETGGSEAMRIDSSGNVGINDSAPDNKLQISDSSIGTDSTANDNNFIKLTNKDANTVNEVWGLGFSTESSGTDYLGGFVQALGDYTSNFNTSLIFGTRGTSGNATERMRIDSGGNLLVGTTNVNPAANNVTGHAFKAGGLVEHANSGAMAMRLNRTDSDGSIIEFRKGTGTVGSIGVNTSGLYIADAGVGFRFDSGGTDDIIPCNATGGAADASINLGSSGARFKDLYLSSAVRWYSGSDQKAYHTYSSSDNDVIHYAASGVGYQFWAGGQRRVDIDASGNLLVGTTSTSTATQGIKLRSDLDAIAAVADGQISGYFGRLNSDGDILNFRKDGTTVGSIGTNNGDLVIHSTASGHEGLLFGNGAILPTDNAGSTNSGAVNLGGHTSRFADLYLSGGVYLGTANTSAEYLDDYEEGTFTATLSSGATTTPTTVGTYTKIGNRVYISLELFFGSITVNGTALQITGLPFNNSGEAVDAFASCSQRVNFDSSKIQYWYLPSGTTLDLKQATSNTNSVSTVPSQASGTFTPSFGNINFHYQTA